MSSFYDVLKRGLTSDSDQEFGSEDTRTPKRVKGENGETAFESAGDSCVDLFNLCRSSSENEIYQTVRAASEESLVDSFVLTMQARDVTTPVTAQQCMRQNHSTHSLSHIHMADVRIAAPQEVSNFASPEELLPAFQVSEVVSLPCDYRAEGCVWTGWVPPVVRRAAE